MSGLSTAVQDFYNGGDLFLFEELIRRVNRQAIGPFFRAKLRRQGRILDAGSGPGFLTDELGVDGACFMDLSWGQIVRCRQRRRVGSFIQTDLESLPFRDGSFDAVVCSNVLHYARSAGTLELLRVTKRGGQMLLAFLEDSDPTRAGIRLGVSMGLFPTMLLNAPLVDFSIFERLGISVKDSATIVFVPPLFQASRELPRCGLVAFELQR